jgi:hypothetical protein
MFEDLYDEISILWFWRWPVVQGEIILREIERVRHAGRSRDTFRLSVVYKFSIGDDGPYSGESFWRPTFASVRRLREAKRRLYVGQPVLVRYRSDNPAVNRLDHSVWQQL